MRTENIKVVRVNDTWENRLKTVKGDSQRRVD